MPTDTKQMKEPSRIIQPLKDIVALVVQGNAAGQTADLQQWKDEDEVEVASVDVTGIITGTGFSGGTFSGSSLTVSGVATSGSVDTGSIIGTVISGTAISGTSGIFQPSVDGGVALILKGHSPTQSGDIQQWQDSTSAVLSHVDADGDWFLGHTDGKQVIIGSATIPTGAGKFHVQPVNPSPTFATVTVRSAVSQTTNLQEWQDSSGNVVSAVGPNGQSSILSSSVVGQLLTVGSTNNHPGTATTLYGIRSDWTAPATTTSSIDGVVSRLRTAASVFTCTTAMNFYSVSPLLGAGSAITNAYGMFVENMGVSGVTNTYGIWIATQSGAATNNYAMVVSSLSTGMTIDGDGKRLALLGAFGTGAITVNTGTHTFTGASIAGFDSRYTAPTTATTGVYGYYGFIRLGSASYGTLAVFRSDTPVYGSGTATSSVGLHIGGNLGAAGITNAYGVLVTNMSGATGNNACIVTGTGTTAALWLNNGNNSTDITGGIVFGSSRDTGMYRQAVGILSIENTATQAGMRINANAAAGSAKAVSFSTANVLRWYMGGNTTAEGGSNAGTNFEFRRYDDSGAELTPRMLTITRSSGLWDFFTGKFQINSSGQLGVGVTANSARVLNVGGTHSGNTVSLFNIISDVTSPATTTTAAYGVYSRLNTVASAFTLAAGYTFRASQPILGAGSAITTAYGMYIQNIGVSGITNAYGLFIEAFSGASASNLPIVINSIATYVVDSQGRVGVGGLNTSMLYTLGNGSAHPGTGVSVYGISSDHAAPSTATTQQAAYHGRWRTSAATFTLATAYVFVADTPVAGAGSSITTAVGLKIENQGNAIVNTSYGILIASQSGSTNPYAFAITNSTTFAMNSNGGVSWGVVPNAARLALASGAHYSASTAIYGVDMEYNTPVTATVSDYRFYAQNRTGAFSFTLASAACYRADVTVIGAGSTITNAYGLLVANIGASGVTNAYGVFISTQSGAATNNIPLLIGSTSTWTVDSNGRTALGVTQSTSVMFYILGQSAHPGNATILYSVLNQPTYPSTTTSTAYNYYSQVRTASASFTLTSAYNFYADIPVLGASSVITNTYGLFIANQGLSGTTSAYGIWIASQSGATNNLPLVIGGTTTYSINSNGQVGMGAAVAVDRMINMGGTHSGTATTVYGTVLAMTLPSTATVEARGVSVAWTTPAAAYTLSTMRAFYAGVPSFGASSAVTNAYGMFVENQGNAAVTNAYGVWIQPQSNAATNNLPLVVGNTSTFAINSSGQVFLGAISTDRYLNLGGTHPNTGTSISGLCSAFTTPATALTTYWLRIIPRHNAGGSYNTSAGINIDAPDNVAPVITIRGINVSNMGASNMGTAYGLSIAAQSGASTASYGARIDTSTTAALWLGGDAAGTTVAGGIVFGSSRDISIFRGSGTTIKTNAAWSTTRTAAPADGDIVAGELAMWFDSTNGASKAMFKAKQADGTVTTGSVALV